VFFFFSFYVQASNFFFIHLNAKLEETDEAEKLDIIAPKNASLWKVCYIYKGVRYISHLAM